MNRKINTERAFKSAGFERPFCEILDLHILEKGAAFESIDEICKNGKIRAIIAFCAAVQRNLLVGKIKIKR